MALNFEMDVQPTSTGLTILDNLIRHLPIQWGEPIANYIEDLQARQNYLSELNQLDSLTRIKNRRGLNLS